MALDPTSRHTQMHASRALPVRVFHSQLRPPAIHVLQVRMRMQLGLLPAFFAALDRIQTPLEPPQVLLVSPALEDPIA
jgi:hypothetical protein